MELTGGVGAAMVVETTAHQRVNIPDAIDMLAAGGRIAQIGITPKEVALHSVYLQKKGADMRFAIGSAGHGIWPNVIRLIESGRIQPEKYLSRCYHLDEAIDAIRAAVSADGGKFVVTPNW